MQLRQPNWTRILTILLVILASLALLYITITILLRFRQAILLFVLGTIVAYVLTPLVNRLEAAFKLRWVAILMAYLMIALGLFALSVSLFTPFVEQSRSLVDNLHTPSASSLKGIVLVQNETDEVARQIEEQQRFLAHNLMLDQAAVNKTSAAITRLQMDVSNLEKGTVSGPSHTPRPHNKPPAGRLPPNPQPQTQVPTTYVDLIASHVGPLANNYATATQSPRNVNMAALGRAAAAAKAASNGAQSMLHIMETTPILLLRSQTWLDQHHIKVDVHDKFGQAARQFSNQGTYILDNAITIVSETVTILLDLTLILIISFYLLNDGRGLTRRGMALIPSTYREQASFFLTSLDKVLGGYIRGQLFLSLLAGILGGGGAAVLGVPYPLLIGIVTFLLESVPVIGPMVAVVPAAAISLFFMPFVTTIVLVVWFLVFQQVVTNILGPRVMGAAVGIHPLEALLAVLVGYPLGGFLGAFLAVPVMGIVHILLREGYEYFVLGQPAPRAPIPVEPLPADMEAPHPVPARPKTDKAAG